MVKDETKLLQLHSSITAAKSLFKSRHQQRLKGISTGDIDQRLKAGSHPLDLEQIEFPEEELRQLFDDFCSVLERLEFQETSEIEKLRATVEAGGLNLESLIKKIFCGDSDFVNSLGERLGVSIDLLAYLGANLGNPLFELYAGQVQGRVDLGNWLKGSCPLCGSEAAFARLRRDDGKRILWCQFCGTEWEYLRIKCPFCSTENHKSLKYLFTEEESPYRVYLCDECRRYVKAIDERKIPEDEKPDLFFENLKTLYLDILVQKDGYRGQNL